MQSWLPVVDASVGSETDHNILVKEAWIRGYGRDIARNDKYGPRPAIQELLALRGRKSGNQFLVGRTDTFHDKVRVEAAVVLDRTQGGFLYAWM